MAKKEELFEKETRYCKIIKSVTLVDGEETFALEKLYIKSLDRYEIRIGLYKDCLDRPNKLIARLVDICADKLATLLMLGIKAGILDKDFKEKMM
ncbi:hypothetical protein [Clostridioides difficile]|uniref:hypothetical protein n=1 Tax=Clostridioides difficile TaxID=1496 RepID=UPI00097FFE75|nr:hypothetical protein [Clostridioides difficile]EGT4206260.1 hypothetical protein [Clostridioides difficile]MCA0636468.1 hypothetical protein [Clostridioides difficile]MCI9908764.1 hypothetical protein [Clostridioides difficile]MCK8754302.1 hypothetical protein [Clostridioides difficile]MCO8869901.1 hypothetical protein [Clostridioides difficile]